MTIVLSCQTFPDIRWWSQVMHANTVIFDTGEHFQKMSLRNRYRIAGANNPVLLTVPLVQGRNQRTPMKDVQIHNATRWQVQHWRTLVSVYKRTPFFDHFEPSLEALFTRPFTSLVDFNLTSIRWLARQLKLSYNEQINGEYLAEYPIEVVDFRDPALLLPHFSTPAYHQVFQDRIGFQPNLSLLDLLFEEGPRTAAILKQA